MSSLEEWFKSLPIVTRSYLVSALGLTTLVVLGILDPSLLILWMPLVWNKLQVWRLVSCFAFFGKFSFPFVMQMLILVRYSSALEQNPFCTTPRAFQGGTADYVFMLMFCAAFHLAVGWYLELMILGPSFVMSILYVWSKRNSDVDVSFWGFRFKGVHLPWVYTAFGILVGNSPVTDLIGIVIGHIYYFAVEVFPKQPNGFNVLTTPAFLHDLFGARIAQPWQAGLRAGGPAGGAPRAAPRGGHNWGAGRALGGPEN